MRTVRGVIAALTLALACLAPAVAQGMPPLASGAGERVLAFDAEITVTGSGDLHVVESIRLRVKGEQIKRGIIRDLPISAGPIEILSVTRDGHDEPYTSDVDGKQMRLRIGSPDVLLTPGDAIYQITYKAVGRVSDEAGTRTLDWSVTGSGWAFGIDAASAVVHLPTAAEATSVKLVAGSPGSAETNGVIKQDAPGTISAHIARPLQPGQGMSISVSWPAIAGPALPAAPQPHHTGDRMIGISHLVVFVFVLPAFVIVL